jgi:hypothetical protein
MSKGIMAKLASMIPFHSIGSRGTVRSTLPPMYENATWTNQMKPITKMKPGLPLTLSRRLIFGVRTLKALIVAVKMKKQKKAVRKTASFGTPLRVKNSAMGSYVRKKADATAMNTPPDKIDDHMSGEIMASVLEMGFSDMYLQGRERRYRQFQTSSGSRWFSGRQ